MFKDIIKMLTNKGDDTYFFPVATDGATFGRYYSIITESVDKYILDLIKYIAALSLLVLIDK